MKGHEELERFYRRTYHVVSHAPLQSYVVLRSAGQRNSWLPLPDPCCLSDTAAVGVTLRQPSLATCGHQQPCIRRMLAVGLPPA